MRPRVLIVAHDIGPVGGMEQQLRQLTVGLSRSGWDVTIVARSCELPADVHVRFVRVPAPSRPFVIAYPLFVLLATLLVAVLRGDRIVQSTGAIVLNRVDLRAVHLCHRGLAQRVGLLRFSRDRLAFRLHARLARVMSLVIERTCFRPERTGRLVAVSEGLGRELKSSYPRMADRVEVIPNGVDLVRFTPGPSVTPFPLRLIFIGGEWDGKGLSVAIEALTEAVGWELWVVGKGDLRRYQGLAQARGVAHRVHFLGAMRDPETVLRRGGAFVLPSVYETFSMVTYEAAACGLPLLATRVSGIEDILDDGVNGWFIDRTASDLAKKMRALANGPRQAESMGAAARRAALRFSASRMVDQHVALYLAIAKQPANCHVLDG